MKRDREREREMKRERERQRETERDRERDEDDCHWAAGWTLSVTVTSRLSRGGNTWTGREDIVFQ